MPWNNQDGNQGGGGPWGGNQPNKPGGGPGWQPPGGRKPNGGGGNAPDLEAMLRRARDRFRRLRQTSGGSGNFVSLAIALAGTLWLLSGFYRVQPDEQAIPKIFGKAAANPVGPGLHYIWPSPIGDVVISRTGSENRIEVGFSSTPERRGVNPGHNENLMLTGDENIINITFVVLWKINDPIKYEFNIRDQEHTITRAAESAIREVIGETPIQAALTEGREDMAAKTRVLLQKMLDEYEAGVTVDGIELQDVSPPEPVKDAFNDVQRARSDGERARNEAEAYRNSILPRAQGEAARKKQDAIGYQAEVVNRATGDADRFKAVLLSYEQAKDVTRERLYLETMEDVLAKARRIVTDTPAGTPVVLPMPASSLPPPASPASAPGASTGSSPAPAPTIAGGR